MSRGPALRRGERVLVRLPSWLGDLVMAEPAVRALAEHAGEDALTLVGLAGHLELLGRRFPRARKLVLAARSADEPRAWRGHDVAVLLTGSFRSAWTAWRAGIPRRAGFARDGRGWLLTDALAPASERGGVPLGLGRSGRAPRHLPRPLGRSLAELLGLVGVTVRGREPELAIDPAWDAAARARRAGGGIDPEAPFLLVNAGARPGSSKGVPPALLAGAVGALARAGVELPLVVAGGAGEEAALAELEGALGGTRALFLRDPPSGLPELLAHMAAAAVVWSGDTGPRHLARATGTPCVVVTGPTDPRHCAIGARERVVRDVVECGPCHREVCRLTGAEHHRCLAELDPARVATATLELLAGHRRIRA